MIGNINNLMIYMGDVAEFKCWIKLYEKKVKIIYIYIYIYITINTNLSKSFYVI